VELEGHTIANLGILRYTQTSDLVRVSSHSHTLATSTSQAVRYQGQEIPTSKFCWNCSRAAYRVTHWSHWHCFL